MLTHNKLFSITQIYCSKDMIPRWLPTPKFCQLCAANLSWQLLLKSLSKCKENDFYNSPFNGNTLINTLYFICIIHIKTEV